jgi:hypothetical protein
MRAARVSGTVNRPLFRKNAARSEIEAKLEQLGHTLPSPIVPPGSYEVVKVHAGVAYVAGHGHFDGATPIMQGIVGRDLALERATEPHASQPCQPSPRSDTLSATSTVSLSR